jgi:hypothetical protein
MAEFFWDYIWPLIMMLGGEPAAPRHPANKAPLIHCGKELSNYNKRLLLGGR